MVNEVRRRSGDLQRMGDTVWVRKIQSNRSIIVQSSSTFLNEP